MIKTVPHSTGFLETPLILVFLNENCCLCICFTELFSFLIAVPIVFSRSMSNASRSTTQNAAR